MKFGKEFMSQMVPEWQETYMNYDHLKTILKDIQNFRQKDKAPPPPVSNILSRKLTLYRAFSGLTQIMNLGFKKTIQLDRRRLVLIDLHENKTLSWDEFSSAVRSAHENRMGQRSSRRAIPERPKEEDYFYSNPEECFCDDNRNSTKRRADEHGEYTMEISSDKE